LCRDSQSSDPDRRALHPDGRAIVRVVPGADFSGFKARTIFLEAAA
jgi:hypothetical protein